MVLPNKDEMPETWLVKVYGRVQGVGYRNSSKQYALAQCINGWVRNRQDGSVELMLQGTNEQLTNMCSWLRHGVPGARVDKLEVSAEHIPSLHFDIFDCLPTL